MNELHVQCIATTDYKRKILAGKTLVNGILFIKFAIFPTHGNFIFSPQTDRHTDKHKLNVYPFTNNLTILYYFINKRFSERRPNTFVCYWKWLMFGQPYTPIMLMEYLANSSAC